MTIQKYRGYAILLIVIVLLAGCFSLGGLATAYANEAGSANSFSVDSYYIGRNTRKLLGLIIVGLAIFAGLKGWRRAVALGCFLTFLGFASIALFTFGRMIASWLNSGDTKLLPIVVFFAGGMLLIGVLHKLYKLMNAFLKKHL